MYTYNVIDNKKKLKYSFLNQGLIDKHLKKYNNVNHYIYNIVLF